MTPTVADLVAIGRGAGLAAVGATEATPFERTLVDLEQRKAEGLSGGMQFTYRNPSRSTDPHRTMDDATCLIVGAYDYQRELPPRPRDQPTGRVATYSSEDHYASLRAALEQIAVPLRAAGHARPSFWLIRIISSTEQLLIEQVSVGGARVPMCWCLVSAVWWCSVLC